MGVCAAPSVRAGTLRELNPGKWVGEHVSVGVAWRRTPRIWVTALAARSRRAVAARGARLPCSGAYGNAKLSDGPFCWPRTRSGPRQARPGPSMSGSTRTTVRSTRVSDRRVCRGVQDMRGPPVGRRGGPAVCCIAGTADISSSEIKSHVRVADLGKMTGDILGGGGRWWSRAGAQVCGCDNDWNVGSHIVMKAVRVGAGARVRFSDHHIAPQASREPVAPRRWEGLPCTSSLPRRSWLGTGP